MTQRALAPDEDTEHRLSPPRGYRERRACPRVDFRAVAQVTTLEHRVLEARVRDVSTDGVQLRCDPQTARAIHPPGTALGPDCGPEILIRFDVPVEDHRRMFTARGRVCYVKTLGENELALGVRFTRVRVGAKKVLAGFIMESMRPQA